MECISESEIRGLADWFEVRVNDNKRKANLHDVESGELYAMYQGIAIGRQRAKEDLEELIGDE